MLVEEEVLTRRKSQAQRTISKSDLIVRDISLKDIPALEKLWANCSNETKAFFHPGFFKAEIHNGYFNPVWRLTFTLFTNRLINKLFSSAMLPHLSWITSVICIRNQIAGFAYIRAKGRGAGTLGIFLFDQVQEKGLGKYLMSKIIKKARDKKMSSIYLRVFQSNCRARRLFESFGFKYIGSPVKVQVATKEMVSLQMVLRL